MFAKSQLIAVLVALPFALAAPHPGPGPVCNKNPLTVTNYTEGPGGRGGVATSVSFDVASPDIGTTSSFSCSGASPGARAPKTGTCSNGGSFTLAGALGPLTVTIPRTCGTLTSLTATGSPNDCDIFGATLNCPPFELDVVN
ncbi:hypothetical protein EXIGLDRAFT_833744 [Exidia glandulosa HHB12029]|uniref:Uncharacterized protein n=1 Tax=Exidia glandulosa HHB12029 TaxID=1314781 RepID=A0A165KFD2_EXIGL|nr:hypothetical protein EXIGLDRAFT_833744 [Exidia glandulosa HHB12029]